MNIFQDYYESKLALEILAKELEEKKEKVIEALKKEPENKAEITGARFSLRKDYVYEFSGKTRQKIASIEFDLEKQKNIIKESQNFIKGLKAQAIEDGTAKLIDTKYIPVCTPVKGGEK